MTINDNATKVFELVMKVAKSDKEKICLKVATNCAFPIMYLYILDNDGSLKQHYYAHLFDDGEEFEEMRQALEKILQETNDEDK